MKQDFYMLRHGETTSNKDKTASGWLDVPLTDLGIEQAAECAGIIKTLDIKPSVIVHTGLQRSLETAKIINSNLGSQLVDCALLKEQHFGDWQGMPWSEIYPLIEKIGVNPPNGETQIDFIDRVAGGFASVFKEYRAPILFVTHGGVFKALAQHYGHVVTRVENCRLHNFVYKGGAGFPYDVQTCHMAEDKVIKRKVS